MKLVKIEKIHEGKFISYYLGHFEMEDGSSYKYEFISRDKNLTINTFVKGKSAGVGMVVYNEDKTKVLLQKEFRMACNDWVINFPAGLIDEGEDAVSAARRELKEETGTDLVEVIDVLPQSYSSHGTSNEIMEIVICTAKGKIKKSCYINEEIEARWYTKEEVRRLISGSTLMSIRTQMFLYYWINS